MTIPAPTPRCSGQQQAGSHQSGKACQRPGQVDVPASGWGMRGQEPAVKRGGRARIGNTRSSPKDPGEWPQSQKTLMARIPKGSEILHIYGLYGELMNPCLCSNRDIQCGVDDHG